MAPTIHTWHPWYRRLHQRVSEILFAPRKTSLRDLDRRALADIGIDPSEIGSIESESHGRARRTRLRIVAAPAALEDAQRSCAS